MRNRNTIPWVELVEIGESWREATKSVIAELTFGCVSHRSELSTKCISNSEGYMSIIMALLVASVSACRPVRSSWRRTISSDFSMANEL